MDQEYIYSEITCPHCDHVFTIKATIMRGFKDSEEVHCPKCKEFITKTRADMGYEIVEGNV
jgi:predicted Zn finger-like uncharacterized protein